MCKNYYFSYLFFVVGLLSCVAQKPSQTSGTLKGTIGLYEGNCMPGPGVDPCEPKPISTMVYITKISEKFQLDLAVDSVQSKADGTYAIDLAIGTYSLFLRDEESIICDLIKCPNTCYCNPFKITIDSTTIVDANLDHATW
ncbi:MAG: hypothetical protein ABJO91_09635 [Ekhidna sp.]